MRRHRAVSPPGVRYRRLRTVALAITAGWLILVFAPLAHAEPHLLPSADVTPSPNPSTTDSTLVMTVPPLQGESLLDAEASLLGQGLIPIADPDSSPPPTAIVVNQKPAAGDRTEPGSRVVLFWETGVAVPDLNELSAGDAQSTVEAAGLTLTVTGDDGGLVSFQDPPAGKVVTAESAVSVTLTTEVLPPQSVFVPNVNGLSLSLARQDLQSQGLVLSPTGDSDALGALATTQDPTAGTQVPRNSRVTVEFAVPTATGGTSGNSTPWLWWLVATSLIVGALATTGLLVHRAARRKRQQRWAHDHVHIHPHPSADSTTRLNPTDGFPPLAIQLDPHSDPGQQFLEETLR